MSRHILALGVLAIAALATAAAAQEDDTYTMVPAPFAQPLGQRFVLVVLDQTDRDLTKGDSIINMMLDTQTGRSWILERALKPGGNEMGYVWVEVPYAGPPATN